MIRNHLKLVLRNLWHNKAQSFILIGGLTIGMTSCILLLQYVNFELSFDNFHNKQDRIYRVVNERIQEGKTVQKGTITYPTIGPTMREEFPEIVNATRMAYSSNMMITKNNEVDRVEPGFWVDEHFLEIFDFKVLAKEDVVLLNEPNELVLTQHLADRYFPAVKGDYQSIIGQEIQIDRDEHLYKIVGVIEDVPANSSLQFEILGSYASFVRYMGEGADNSWTWSDFYHYVELAPEAKVEDLEAKFPAFSERHFRGTEVSGSEEIFTLQPLAAAHLYSENLEYEIGTTANGKAIWSLLIIAFFILILAWVNYVNLSSVKAIERSKEVGVRKVIGASKFQLIRQFLIEAASVNIISLGFALTLTWLLTPWFGSNFGVDVASLKFWSLNSTNIYLFLALFSLIALGILVSGAYPAYLLSSPQISNVIKGIFTKHKGGEMLRKVLVVFQFTMSIALIVGTWLVTKQIDYMTQQDLGFEVEQIMTLNPPEMTAWDSTFINKMDVFKSELAAISGVESASTS
ncbi:MAG: ABC transporter permease, partial [Bacteroidota bacterium]